MKAHHGTPTLLTSAALFMAVAGAIHLAVVPLHWQHAPAHGLLLALAGMAELVWGMLVWRRPSLRLYVAGSILGGGLLALWILTRLLPAPFGHGPEQVEVWGVICKLAEGFALVTLLVMVFHGTAAIAGRSAARRALGLLLLASLVFGSLTYGIARAAEPVLPWLGGAALQHEHSHEHKE